MTNYLGLDIGKTKLAAGIVSNNGTVNFYLEEPTDTSGGGQKIIPQTMSIIRRVANKGYTLNGIGVGSTGMIDHKRGYIIGSGSLPNFNNIPIMNILEKEFKVPVYVENDVNAATVGEYIFGAGKGTKSMALLAIGTGVGIGIIIDGKLYHGAHEIAGQIAHIPLFAHGNKTTNDIISGAGIARRGTALWGREVSTADVFRFASEGKKEAKDIIEEAVRGGSIVIAWLQNIIDPEKIVLMGGVIENEENYFIKLKEYSTQLLRAYLAQLPEEIPLAKAKLGHQAGVIGAAAACILQSKSCSVANI